MGSIMKTVWGEDHKVQAKQGVKYARLATLSVGDPGEGTWISSVSVCLIILFLTISLSAVFLFSANGISGTKQIWMSYLIPIFLYSILRLSPDSVCFSTYVYFKSADCLTSHDHLMTVQATAVSLILDYNNSFLTGLSASVLASLQYILHIGNEYDHFCMQSWSLYLSP